MCNFFITILLINCSKQQVLKIIDFRNPKYNYQTFKMLSVMAENHCQTSDAALHGVVLQIDIKFSHRHYRRPCSFLPAPMPRYFELEALKR